MTNLLPFHVSFTPKPPGSRGAVDPGPGPAPDGDKRPFGGVKMHGGTGKLI